MPATATFLAAANLIGSVVLELMVSRRNNLSGYQTVLRMHFWATGFAPGTAVPTLHCP